MKNLAGFIFVMIIVFSNYLKAQDLFDYGIKVGLSRLEYFLNALLALY